MFAQVWSRLAISSQAATVFSQAVNVLRRGGARLGVELCSRVRRRVVAVPLSDAEALAKRLQQERLEGRKSESRGTRCTFATHHSAQAARLHPGDNPCREVLIGKDL